jgi:hypothetical protein
VTKAACTIAAFALLAFGAALHAAEWQWSVVAPTTPTTQPVERRERPRAFLWIPPNCERVRGIVLGQHNMEEEPILEHPAFRATLAELGFAEVWVAPAFDAYFRFDQGAGERFDAMMAELAEQSGYAELTHAPLVPIGHSAAASMPWYIAAWKPQRVLACISTSGQWPYWSDDKNAPHVVGRSIDSVPGIVTMGEYEWADENLPKGLKVRAEHPTLPLSALGCPADGHFAATDEKVEFLSLYVKKAVQYRLRNDAPSDRALELNKIDPRTNGWLVDRYRADKAPLAPAAPVDKYAGDPSQAFWWFDEELAKAAEAFQARHRGKPALLGYVQEGATVPQVNGTHQQVTLRFLPGEDGVTFSLTPAFLDTVPDGRPTRWAAKKAGEPIDVPTGGPPIVISKITGPVKKLSDDTWRLDLYRESLLSDRRGNDAWVVAIWPGGGGYKRAVQQAVMRIPRRNDKGVDQTITFPEIQAQRAGGPPVKLAAVSTSGLPVRYFVREGPAEVSDDGMLAITPIPPRAKFPVKVTVVAWQWGRSIEPKFKTAELVERTFHVTREQTP